jgi:hypothetical protein
MPKQGEFTVWEDRWQALKQILNQMLANDWPSPTYKSLIACLDAFGESQFSFFKDGFKAGNLWPSALYPMAYILGTTLNQIAYDIGVIQRAAQPREDNNVKMKDTLNKADQLAQLALNLAVDNGLLMESTVISYFNKSAYIRTIPYAPIALVAVPYTSTAVSRDFLATPHEIGHHVYQHSPGLLADLRDRLPLQPDWCSRWQEEIFADVYGCLVAGPVIGLDFQDLLLGNDLEDFMTDDGEHPVEAIRPFAYAKVLDELGFVNAAGALKSRWQKKLKARNNPKSFVPFGGFNSVNLAKARKELESMALAILHYLIKEKRVKPKYYWSEDLVEGEKLSTLYEKFDTWVNQLFNITIPELITKGDEVGILVGGKLTNKRQIGDTQTWIDSLKLQGGYKLPPEAWEPVFSSEGWNVGGPGTGAWPP